MFLLLISSIAGVLAYPPFNFYPLGLLFLAPYFLFLIKESRFWRLILGSFLFRVVFIIGLAYFVFDPLFFLQSVAIFLLLPLAIYLFKKYLKIQKPIFIILVASLLYFLADYAFSYFGFLPAFIVSLGNSLGSSLFLGLSRLGGIWGLEIFAVVSNCLIVFIWLLYSGKAGLRPAEAGYGPAKAGLRPAEAGYGPAKAGIRKLSMAVALFLLLIIGGLILSQFMLIKNSASYNQRLKFLNIAALTVDRHFDEGAPADAATIDRKLSVLKNDLRDQDVDLIIFPEYLFDTEFEDSIESESFRKFGILNNGFLIGDYKRFARDLDSNLIVNLTAIRNDGRYNTTMFINRKGEIAGISDKMDLTLGGEYWPFEGRPLYFDLLEIPASHRRLAIYDDRYQYKAGAESELFNLANGPLGEIKFGKLACLEIHYPQRIRDLKKKGADFVVYLSSNNWIAGGLEKYLGLATNWRRIMSVWQNLPIITSGRSDWAGIFYPDGSMEVLDFKTEKGYNIFKGRIKI